MASGFLDERRDLIPLWDVQEDLARRLEHVSAGGLAEGMFEEYFLARLLEAESRREHPRPPEEVRRSYDDAHDDDILASAEEQCAWLEEIGVEQVDVYFKLRELAIFGGAKGG